MSEHAWVKMTSTPVSVVSDPTSVEGFYAIDTDVEPIPVYGCAVCSAPLNHDTVNSACSGYDPG